MEFKVVLSDPKTGKSYQRDVKDEKAKKLSNLIVGNEFDGSILGLTGYKLLITGGSDKSGFPMKRGVHGVASPKILMSEGIGYNPRTSVRKRKRVRGERIADDIVQVNTKISRYGREDIEVLLGIKKEEEPETVEEVVKAVEEGTKEEEDVKEEKEAKTEIVEEETETKEEKQEKSEVVEEEKDEEAKEEVKDEAKTEAEESKAEEIETEKETKEKNKKV